MGGYEDSPLKNKNGAGGERSFLESLSDDSLLNYISQLSQGQTQALPQKQRESQRPRLSQLVEHQEKWGDRDKDHDKDQDKDQDQFEAQAQAQQDEGQDQYQYRDQEYSRDDYFHDKARQQLAQDEVFREKYGGGKGGGIFDGCSIYINGFTRPGRLQLHEMIVLHGGRFVHYMSAKGQVSHIVASNLPLKKRVELRNYKVCRPEWIVDSIKTKRLLPWQNYSLFQAQDQAQRPLPLLLPPVPVEENVVDCKHPHFLEQFFAHSRLHHLSSWKADLRAHFLEKFIENPSNPPPQVAPNQFTVLHIDFDCFFASVAALCTPDVDISVDPVVVCHGTKSSDIASCNYVARQYGIRNGMWVSHAEKLIPADVKLVRLSYNFDQFEVKSKAFYQVLHDLEFQLVLPISIDEAVCCVTRRLSREQCEELCQRVRSMVALKTACSVSVGCSDSLVLARLTLKRAKPDGYQILTQSELDQSFLTGLKPRDLPGVGPSLVDKLETHFQQRPLDLAQLQESSLNSLQRCVGEKLGNKIYLALRGKDDEESAKMLYDPQSVFQRKSLSIDINWGVRFDTIHEIDQFIDRCTQYLTDKLESLNRATSQITLRVMRRCKDEAIEPSKYLGMGRCDPFNRSTRLGVPTSEPGIIATEVKSSFRSLGCPPRDLRGIAIQFKLEDVRKRRTALQQQLKLPLVDANVYENLPQDVKKEVGQELKRRKIGISKAAKAASPAFRASSYEERFMQELPTQIRQEVRNDIRITKKARKTKLGEMQEHILKRQEKAKNYKAHFLGEASIFEPIQFQGETRFKKIIHMVLEWVDGTIPGEGPHEQDLHLFDKYLNRLSDANRLPLMLRLAKLVATRLDLRCEKYGSSNGFQEWEKVLLTVILPKLNKNKHTFQTVRKLDIDFDT
ncbi:related to DNA repair protein REV1 [Zygosaccharomyces bailii]|nr:related to DNA repair protein REV1 [Zygosaccharomyces bailii]